SMETSAPAAGGQPRLRSGTRFSAFHALRRRRIFRKHRSGADWAWREITAAVRAHALEHAARAISTERAFERADACVAAVGRQIAVAAFAVRLEHQHQTFPAICSIAWRRCSAKAAKRDFTALTVSADAVSGRPELNGGAGAYSIMSWIIFAVSSPA